MFSRLVDNEDLTLNEFDFPSADARDAASRGNIT